MSPEARAQNNAVPHVNQPLVPASAAPGGASFSLTVNGTGFAPTSTVYWNGSPRATTFVKNTQLIAQISTTDIASPSTGSVTVVNVAPGGGVSNVAFFQVINSSTQASFSTSSIAVGSGPAAAITADLNADGYQDLVSVNQSSNSVSILLGGGGGSFQPHVDYAVGLGPQDIVAGDFNRDGMVDLATVNAGENSLGQPANSISVMLGNGDGTFRTHVDYGTGQLPVQLALADFNGDGFLDLATVNEDSYSISILLGNGDGTFQAHIDYNVGALPMGLVAADFNGDGIPDLASVNYQTHNISILLGNGDGTFQSPVDYSAPTHPLAIVAADFNGDGIQDVAVAVFSSSSVAVLLGNGDGTFGNYIKYPTGAYPESVVTGDFNGDGVTDLALPTDTGLGSVSVLFGNGDGSFQPTLNFPAGLLPIGISTGDFNNDGMLDLAAADLTGNTTSVLLQTTLLLAPTSLTFSSQGLGSTSPPQTVTVTNIGSTTLTISSVSTAAPFAETDTCSTPIAPGANCTVSVTFSPAAPGAATGSVSLTDSAAGSPHVVSLSGTGTGSVVTLNPTNVNFGNVQVGQTSPAQTVTLTNTGNSALAITSVTATGDYAVSSQCGSSVAAGASCSLNVTLTPTTTGTRTGTLSVADNATGSPQTASLTGTGVQGSAQVSPTSLTFATQLISTTSPAQVVTLSNTGTGAFTVISISATGDFKQTNNCGSSVAAGASCTINVTFTPTNGGTRNGTLTITDTAPSSPQTVSLTGTGTAIQLSPPSLTFGTVTPGQTSSPMSVVMSNVSTTSVTITSITLTGANPTEFAQSNNCGSSLAGGASCTFNITFTPAAPGLRTASLSISDTGGASPHTVSLTGTGGSATPPAVSLNPSSLTFAPLNVGSTSPSQSVTLTNSGGSPLTITSITVSGSFTLTNQCGTSLNPGQNCSFSVTYTATVMGTQTGAVTVIDNAADSPQSVSLTGTGLQAQASLAPASLTFAVQVLNTTSPAQAVTLTNTGNTTLTVSKINLPAAFAETDTCSAGVAPGASCVVNVTFKPTNQGSASGNLSFTDNAPGSPQTVGLSGTGTAVSFAPTGLNFGSITLGQTSAPQAVTMSNVGPNSINITSVTFTGANPTDFSETPTCGSTLAAGASCTFSITFTPGGQGARSASLSVADTGGGSPQTVALSGTGNPTSSGAAASLVPSSLNFGSVNIGSSSSTLSAVLTSTGATTLTISNIAISGPFSFTSSCPSSLTSGQSCSISLTFTPTTMGSASGTLTVTDNATPATQTVGLSGTGLQPQPVFSPSSLTFATQLINTTSPAQNVTLTNTGNTALTITKVTASGAFAQTNTCGSSVGAGASCTITVTFTPTGGGTVSGSVTVTDSGAGSPQTVSLTGTGTVLSVSPLSLSWGTISLGQSGLPQVAILINLGSFNLGSLSASIIGTNAADFSDTTTCASVLNAGATCLYTVTFTPSASGLRTASLSISYGASGGGSPQTVALSGTGGQATPPAVTFAPTSLAFGSINVGSSSTLALTLTNTGGSNLTVTSVAAGGDYTQTNTCSAGIVPGQTCSISVTFKPTIMGPDNSALIVTDNAGNSPQAVSLTGTGLQPQASLSTTSVTFATQVINTTSPAQNVTLTNTGNTALSVTKLTASSNYAQTNTCGSSVAAGASCTISVTFTPVGAGAHSGTVTITDGAPDSPQTINLNGTGTTLSVAPLALAWGTINLGSSGSPQIITLVNKGSFSVGSLAASITGVNAGDFTDTTTCPSTLSAGASCTYSVTFTPSASGTRAASLSISYGSSGGGSPQTVALSGTGGNPTPPAVTFTPPSLSFGSINVGSSSTLSLTVTNTGGSNLTVSSVAAGGDYTQTNTCSASVAPGQSCSISVTFKPTIMGTDNGSLTVTDNAGNSPQSVGLTGTGLQPQAVLSATSLTFATQVINTTSPTQNVTLTNTGNTALSVTKVTISGNFAQTNTCGSSVAAGANCSISVTFTPTSAGAKTGTVTITDGAPTSPQTVSLTGTGTLMSVSPLSLSWGTITLGQSGASQKVTVTNKGTTTVGSLAASIGGANPIDFTDTTTCTSTLTAGASCSYTVTFTPTASGLRSASLSISYGSSGGGSPQTVALSGTGGSAGPPAVTFTPSSLSFGSVNVGSSSTLSLTVTNTGGSNLTISNVAGGGDYTETNTCSASVLPGQSCSISVTFKPTVMGADNGNLTVTDNAGNSPQSVPLTGTGLQPQASLSPTSLTFATQVINTTSPAQIITLTNTGNTSLSVTKVTASANYAETNTCGSSVAAGASCTISVTFTPVSAGVHTGTVTITDGAPTSPQTVSLTGTGTTLSISPLSLTWGAINVGQSSSPQIVTLVNKGSFTVGSLAASLTGANPADYSDTTSCTSTLNAGASCTYTVTFTPSASGLRSASLSISYGSAGGGSPQTVSLSGTGQ